MAAAKASLSATNIAIYHHLNCDLYLWNTYNDPLTRSESPQRSPELSKAQYHRGEDWEATLLAWLDRSNLLLRVPSFPTEASDLMENILLDDRDHFFIAGLQFWPPQDALNKRYEALGLPPVKFGLAKPDLIEVVRKDGRAIWKVVDAKASKAIKTSHHAQIYFYTLCLSYILQPTFFQEALTAGIWLPPANGFDVANPDLADIKTIDITLLSSSLDAFFFRQLPIILTKQRDQVRWHLNPSCKSCKFAHDCEAETLETGQLGVIPNLSVDDILVLKDLLYIAKGRVEAKALTDIEELHTLVSTDGLLDRLAQGNASVVKKSRRLLAIPRLRKTAPVVSPIVEAARSKQTQVIPRLNYTCPSKEDLATVISLVADPSTADQGLGRFCITVHTSKDFPVPRLSIGTREELVGALANLIRSIIALQGDSKYGTNPTAQFYVWSSNERNVLQSSIIHAALSSDMNADDARLCIGALAQGAALLQTAYQPLLLSGALLGFLSKGRRVKKEYQACLARMNLPTSGTLVECRKRVEAAIVQLNEEKDDSSRIGRKQRELGQIPRVVVLKREVERLFALPLAGYWDLEECHEVMLSEKVTEICPSEEEVFGVYRHGTTDDLEALLKKRNHAIYEVLSNMRERACPPGGPQLLVNEAKVLSVNFMDLCRNDTLRKLFYMQQFEVLTKLMELWNSRIDGCPDAPVLEFRSRTIGAQGNEYVFKLVSGILDMPPDKDRPFYDKLLVKDMPESEMIGTIPVEALFDDLAVSGHVFPLSRYTRANWDAQTSAVREQITTADIKDIKAVGRETLVTLHVWSTSQVRLELGSHYRLSPRFVDFNTTKVLSSLFEIDLQYETGINTNDKRFVNDLARVPYLQLILDPQSFGHVPTPEKGLKIEGDIQKLFKDLEGLGEASARSLVLKPSQHKAVQRILSNRLSVIWGPPGTGKTYTICLSLLRLLEVERRLDNYDQRIIFLTAMTHAAIDAMHAKLLHLMECYRTIASLPTEWLNDVRVEHILKGSDHAGPSHTHLVHIYAGTLYQLYNFAKNRNLEVDTLVVDEAGQIALGSLSLVMRSLSPTGRLIVAGDSEQLAPILSAQYPQLLERCLFGSVLDSLMYSRFSKAKSKESRTVSVAGSSDDVMSSQGTVVQLTENFRLNPDLGEFVSTIYSRQFKPQKVQNRQLAVALKQAESLLISDISISKIIVEKVRGFFVSLSSVMLRKPQNLLKPPRHQLSSSEATGLTTNLTLSHRPISLALIKLRTLSLSHVAYEMHVNGEAAIAACLVEYIRKCSPNDDIFVATPHRIQREAVKNALQQFRRSGAGLEEAMGNLKLGPHSIGGQVTVDTIERLQGSEAAFVICLFSVPQSHTTDLGFLLERRRLNVAISRAKSLCILVTSDEVLRPSVRILASEDTAKGYAFLKAYEERAWSYDLAVDLDSFRDSA